MTKKRKRSANRPYNAAQNRKLQMEGEEAVPAADVVIDGSLGEGGGQVVRMSLALASVLNRSVRIEKIRRGRSKPGLQAQHAAGAQLVSRITQSQLHGGQMGSSALTQSRPATARDKGVETPLECSVGTAGATALVLQAALPAALCFLPSGRDGTAALLKITGGTTALFAPTSDYIDKVLVPNLTLFGLRVDYKVEKHGFFPRGGGVCTIGFDTSECSSRIDDDDSPCDDGNGRTLRACNIVERGAVTAIKGTVLICGGDYERLELGQCMAREAVRTVRRLTNDIQVSVPMTEEDIIVQTLPAQEGARGKNVSITMYATTASGSVLGSSAIWSEKDAVRIADSIGLKTHKSTNVGDLWQRTAAHIGHVAVEELCTTLRSGAVVDAHMADQLCIFMIMAKGTSRLLVPEPTQHLRSVVAVAEKFGVVVRLENVSESSNQILYCEGVGVKLT